MEERFFENEWWDGGKKRGKLFQAKTHIGVWLVKDYALLDIKYFGFISLDETFIICDQLGINDTLVLTTKGILMMDTDDIINHAKQV